MLIKMKMVFTTFLVEKSLCKNIWKSVSLSDVEKRLSSRESKTFNKKEKNLCICNFEEFKKIY